MKDGFALKKSWKNKRIKLIVWLICVGAPSPEAAFRKSNPDFGVRRPHCHPCYPGRNELWDSRKLITSLSPTQFPYCKIKKWKFLDGLWALFISNILLLLSIGKRGSDGALTKKRKNPKIQKCYFVRTSQSSSQSSRTGALCQKICPRKSTQRPNRKAGSWGKQLFPFFLQEQGDIS